MTAGAAPASTAARLGPSLDASPYSWVRADWDHCRAANDRARPQRTLAGTLVYPPGPRPVLPGHGEGCRQDGPTAVGGQADPAGGP